MPKATFDAVGNPAMMRRMVTVRNSPMPGRAKNARRKVKRKKNPRGSMTPRSDVRIVHNKMLGGWFVVRGPHQTPLNGRFNSKAEAQAWLQRWQSGPLPNPREKAQKIERYIVAGAMRKGDPWMTFGEISSARYADARGHAASAAKVLAKMGMYAKVTRVSSK